ncbi:disease resistance RPP13-like protein 4 [Carex rostrata]
MYLNSKDIIETMNKHGVRGVHLGSWRCTTEVHNGVKQIGSEEKKLKDHIEVNQTDFLKKMSKNMDYLSLRGISGIVEIPASIGRLDYLMILDLRSCHNLEKLPQKPSRLKAKALWFPYLEVLDISECYLLDYMPKWVCELPFLEVLKGFVVGSLGNKNQSCSLGDLSNLKKLRKLSIRFTIDNLGPEVFRGFNSLNELSVLTITWRQNKEIPTYSLPKYIEKLDIRCYPEAEVLSKLQNPGELTNLKRLYIRGGNLTTIPCHDNWQVEILRLRFLNKLVYPTDWEGLRRSFKKLKYVEYVGCTKPMNFPNDGHSWNNEE